MLNRLRKIKSGLRRFNKRRPLIISIDGDGFAWSSNFANKTAGRIFYEEILKKYPLNFTASVTAKDMLRNKNNRELAKEIVALKNVEAASHSWTHPRSWQGKNLDLKHEILDSVRFINNNLLIDNKKVKIFLWTGECNPDEKALHFVSKLQIVNLNGNEIDRPYIKVGKLKHFMSRAYPDWHYMDLAKLWVKKDDPKILRSYRGDLGGYKKVIKRFKKEPQLPIHLWLHWYSAVRKDSLDAIKFVLEWCLKQQYTTMFASDYIKSLR